jgi:plasmid stabilization system protein ParE
MKLRMLETAEFELDQAVAWYRARDERLADRFMIEVIAAGDKIIAQPNAWHPLCEGIRRFRLNRFPYGLIYSFDADEILVIAIAHHSRRPGYWRDRLSRK